MEVTTGWTKGKLGESSVGKERDGSDGRVDGRETVGNSLLRAPLRRSEMEAKISWTEGRKGNRGK